MKQKNRSSSSIVVQGLHPQIIKEKDSLGKQNKDYNNYLVYKNALDQAFKDDEIKNIAITGVYGSGKSSLWKTYELEQKGKIKSITVSLGEFTGKANVEDEAINHIEIKIINQILYQINNSTMAKSSLNTKFPDSYLESFLKLLIVSLSIFSMFFIVDKTLRLDHLLSKYKLLSSPLIYSIVLSFLLAFIIRKALNTGDFKFNKINIQGAEIEPKHQPGDILDQNISELVYLILEDEIDVIVFEDLDRFQNIDLFTNFRELNFLINQKSTDTVRFIYMIKDGLFPNKNRAKFFDYILPVMPVISGNNSREKALDLFRKIPQSKRPSEQSIKQITLYIDDMRVLNSIFNEYQIYWEVNKADLQHLNNDNLLAIITVKNLFPQEFDKLQQNKGYIASLFAKKEKSIKSEIIKKEAELEKITDETIKNMYSGKVAEKIILAMPAHVSFNNERDKLLNVIKSWVNQPEKNMRIRTYHSSGKSVNLKEFISLINSELDEDEKFSYEHIINQEQLREEAYQIENKINAEIKFLQTSSIKEWLQNNYKIMNDDFFTYKISEDNENKESFFEEFELDKKHYNSIISSRYYPFIRFALAEGYINENYLEYIHRFYERGLSIEGIQYINRLNAMMENNPNVEIKDPEYVLNELSLEDLSKPGGLNYSILNYLIDKENTDGIIHMINSITLFEKFNDWEIYLSTINFKKILILVQAMLKNDYHSLFSLLTYEYKNTENKYTLFVAFYSLFNKESLGFSIGELNTFVENNPKIIVQMDRLLNSAQKKKFWNNLSQEKTRLQDLSDSKISKNSAKQIWNNQLFIIDVKNTVTLIAIIERSEKEEILTSLFDYLFTKYELNDEQTITLLKEYSQIMSEDKIAINILDEKTLIKILNYSSDFDLKEMWIKKSNRKLTDLENINVDIWESLLKHKKLTFTSKNIRKYWTQHRKTTDAFIEWMNEGLDYQIVQLPTTLAQHILSNYQLNSSLKLYQLAVKYSALDYQVENIEKNIEINKLRLLIKKDKIYFSYNNLLFIQKYCSKKYFINFINNNNEKFIEFIERNGHRDIKDEFIYVLLNHGNFDTNDKKVIINSFGIPVSLFKINNGNKETKAYIMDHAFDLNDVNQIMSLNHEFELWEQFIQKLNRDSNFRDEIMERFQSIESFSQLILDDLSNDKLKIESLIQILVTNDNIQHFHLKKLIQNISSLDNLYTVFNGEKIKIKNQEQLKIANILEAKGFIAKSDTEIYLVEK